MRCLCLCLLLLCAGCDSRAVGDRRPQFIPTPRRAAANDTCPIPDPQPTYSTTYYYAKWCAPCGPASKIVSEKEFQGHQILKFDVDTQTGKSWAKLDKVTAVPAFLLWKDGQVILRTSDPAVWAKSLPKPK